MKKRKLVSKKKRKPSQRILINIIVGTTFSIAMGILIWLTGREMAPGSYHIVLITLGVGMSAVLIPFVIVFIIMRKKEKSQEKDIKLDNELVKEENDLSMEQTTTVFSKINNINSSPESEPIERKCDYCGHEPVIEGEICPKCDKYILIKSNS